MRQVSSSAVRSALAEGDIDLVSKLLDRRHRLVVQTSGEQRFGGGLARWACSPYIHADYRFHAAWCSRPIMQYAFCEMSFHVCTCRLTLPRTAFMNQSPREGLYEVDIVVQMPDGEYILLGKSTALLSADGLELQVVPKCAEVDGVAYLCIDF